MKFLGIDDDGVGKDGHLPCFGGDPQPFFPDFATLINPLAIVPVDQYGALGMEAARQNPANPRTVPPWWVCPFIDFCDGPFTEALPDLDPVYLYRWQVFLNLRTRLVFYRRTGTPYVQAPLTLIPAPLTATSTEITLSFDANARPYFGYEDTATGLCYLAFTVAGVPTFVNFAGSSPKLFFNGQLQRDNAMTDVVCYYIRAGILRARFQRDTFGVEYTIADVSGTFGALTRLTKTDRESTDYLGDLRQVIFAWGTPNTVEIELRSSQYPPFPIDFAESMDLGLIAASGLYREGIVPGGTYDDEVMAFEPIGASGSYNQVVVPGGTYTDEELEIALLGASGTYAQVVVPGGTYTDEVMNIGLIAADGDYIATSVNGGTYTDEVMNFAPTIPTGTYA